MPFQGLDDDPRRIWNCNERVFHLSTESGKVVASISVKIVLLLVQSEATDSNTCCH